MSISSSSLLAQSVPFNEHVLFTLMILALWMVKCLGYYGLALWVLPRYPEIAMSPVVFALMRAVLGIVVGSAYYVAVGPR